MTFARPITPRGLVIDESSATHFDALTIARSLMLTSNTATLSTIDPESGFPYGMVTNLAVLPDGTPFFFVTGLAIHARNIEQDSRISLAVSAERVGDVLLRPRLTVAGYARPIENADQDTANRIYLRRFPKSKVYLTLRDARLYRMEITDLQLNGGPARNAVSDVTPQNLLVDLRGADELMRQLDEVIDSLNAIEGLPQWLAGQVGAEGGRYRITGVDPEGINISSSEKCQRYWFASRVLTVKDLYEAIAIVTP